VPTPGSLNGDVHLSHYALQLASRPLPKLSIRGNAAYDGRDDQTTRSPSTMSCRYLPAEQLSRRATARIACVSMAAAELRLGPLDTDRRRRQIQRRSLRPGQVITNTQETQSWGPRHSDSPLVLELHVEIRRRLRKTSSFNAAALPVEENRWSAITTMPRDRVFSRHGFWAATSTLTWTVEGYLAKDTIDPRRWVAGRHEQRASTTLTWTPRDTLSAYIDAGYDGMAMLQNGYTGVLSAPWLAADTERF